MKKVIIVDDKGSKYNATISEFDESLLEQQNKDKKIKFKEHLYMGYLIIGTIAFTLGILISIKRLKSNT